MKTLILYPIMILLLTACSVNKRRYGNYFNKWRYWGRMYTLRQDSTFSFFHRTNAGEVTTTGEDKHGAWSHTTSSYIFSDSSYGKYLLKGDTLYLTYFTDSIHGQFNGFNIRPERLLWRKKKLFYFFKESNQPIVQKDFYMKWSKYKIGSYHYQPNE